MAVRSLFSSRLTKQSRKGILLFSSISMVVLEFLRFLIAVNVSYADWVSSVYGSLDSTWSKFPNFYGMSLI